MHSNYQTQQHALLHASNGISQQANLNQQQLLLQQQLQQQGQIRQIASGSTQQKPRIFTGKVTKLHENFGFVDEDVFFQLSSCEGKIPSVGDRVLVEAQYNPNMPFKWNASRVQTIPQQQQSQTISGQVAQTYNFQGGTMPQGRSQQQHIYAAQIQNPQPQGLTFTSSGHGGAGLLGPAPVNVMSAQIPQQRQQQMSGGKGNKRNVPRSGGRDRRSSPHQHNARVRSRSGEKSARKKRSRTPPSRKISPSPGDRRSISSDKVHRRPAPRYMVQCAKYPLTRKSSDVIQIRNLCPNMYIPSDFFRVKFNWQDSFPLQQPLCAEKSDFHILSKDIEPLGDVVQLGDGHLNPSDSNHSWTARVMLLQIPSMKELYRQCCGLAEESLENFLHPSRLYQFLLGYKSKKEPMAIGGAWSPTLDGPDPANNPHTLIKTAIRTCKALTGIDLSKCTKWYRMLEIQYHRDAETRKGLYLQDRVETTVIFVPDVHSCMPTATEYACLRSSYLKKFDEIQAAEQNSVTKENVSMLTPADSNTTNEDEKEQDEQEEEETEKDVEVNATLDTQQQSETYATADEDATEKKENDTPTKIDVKTLKVDSLRKELEARGLPWKGLKTALVTRLKNALKQEEEEEEKCEDIDQKNEEIAEKMETSGETTEQENKSEDTEEDKPVSPTKDEKSGKSSKDEQDGREIKKSPELALRANSEKSSKKKIDFPRLKRHYTLPDHQPLLPVHPNPVYRKGKFECAVTSLANLLNYHQDDNKESIFENALADPLHVLHGPLGVRKTKFKTQFIIAYIATAQVSLFAEAFNEMLQRHFAFNIYKALKYPLPAVSIKKEEEKNESQEEEVEKKRKKNEEDEEEPKAKKNKSGSEEGEEEKEILESTTEKDGNDTEKKTPDVRESKDGKKHEKSSKDKDSKTENTKSRSSRLSSKIKVEKMVTVRCELLLSFVFFDQTHCGYIREVDICDIIHSIGIGLSRSQISKLIAKFMERDCLYYRKLTDVAATGLNHLKELVKNVEKIDVDDLVNGNEILMSVIGFEDEEMEKIPDVKNGVVIYKNAVVDVGSLMEKLKSSEDNRLELEETLENLKHNLESTNKLLSKTQKEHKQLESNFESTRKKLCESQANYKLMTEAKNKYEKTLKNIKVSAEGVLSKQDTTKD